MKMKTKTLMALIGCCLTAAVVMAAELKNPVARMSEAELLAVLKENGLNDKVTACQELTHVGTKASIPVLAALLSDSSAPALFHAACFALENIPGAEAESAMEKALAELNDSNRRKSIEVSLRSRRSPLPPGYEGASEKIVEFPPKNAIQRGDPTTIPQLVKTALGTGVEAANAKRSLIGFPNDAVVTEMLALAEGRDEKKAKLAVDVLGDRCSRAALPKLYALVRSTKSASLRNELFKAFASLCDAKDVPTLLGLLKDMPKAERLVGGIIRIGMRSFVPETANVEIVEARYGHFGAAGKKGKPKHVDVKEMVTELVKSGERSIMASNKLAGQGGFPRDPAPGLVKELRMTYCVNGGPEISSITRENSEIELIGWVLQNELSKCFVDACKAAQGDYRAALVKIIDALDRRGNVPGADEVLFRPIFNGKDLAGWSQKDDFFSVKDGVITGASTPEHPCKPNHHLIYTAETFADFEFLAEFRLSRNANSGVQLRCLPQLIGDNGYQADMNGNGAYVGFIYHPKQHLIGARGANVAVEADGKKTVSKFADGKALQNIYNVEQWNEMRVKVEGRMITVWINGVRMTSVEDQREAFLPPKGHVGLQLHQGPPMTVEYRNVRVRN